jgi:23S rRNA (uracil1939-C5)-methyltransferase
MNKGEEFVGIVSRVDFPNKAILMVEGEKVTIKNLVPGQTIRGAVTKKRSGKYQGRLIEVLKAAPNEIEAVCPVFGLCGGCLYQTLPYEDQLVLKEKQVKRILETVTGPLDDQYEGIISSPESRYYRNKMEYSFSDSIKGGPLCLGMHQRGSMYAVADGSECILVHSDFNAIVRYTLDYFTRENIPFYYKRTHEGFLRFLMIRRGVATNELMVNIITSSQLDFDLTPWKEGLLNLQSATGFENRIVSVVHTINDTLADAIKPDEVRFLYGQEFFYEKLLGLTFKVSPYSFFQTNSLGAEKLYDLVRHYVGETRDKVVFDLYSGTGTITQLLAPIAKKAIGVEIVEEAVQAARMNAEINKLTNCEFIAGDVLQVLDELTEKPDVIILDPPREGIHPKALPKIIDYGVKNIVYVSCKPTSLAKDLIVFMQHGYTVEKLSLVDLFPNTPHVEAIVLMSKKVKF